MGKDSDNPEKILGVQENATKEEIRAAYLEKVKQCSPESHPEEFERIRDAYALIGNPRRRAKEILEGPSPFVKISNIFKESGNQLKYVDPEFWLRVLKEKRK